MRIAVDLDGVVFDTEREFRVLTEIHDIDVLKANNIIDNCALKFQDRYNWSKKECDNFYKKHVFEIEETSHFMPGCKKVLKLLKSLGHELHIISARGIFSEKQIEISKRRLNESGLDIFKEYIFKGKTKHNILKNTA